MIPPQQMDWMIQPGMTLVIKGTAVTFDRRIGEGGQAVVWQVSKREFTSRIQAAKFLIIPYEDRNSRDAKRAFEIMEKVEAVVWPRFQSATSHVVPLNDEFRDRVEIGEAAYIIQGFYMPLSELGDLESYIHQTPARLKGVGFLRSLFIQISEGVKSGHDVDLIHCDIKPSNVLLFPESGGITAKLMDFGTVFSTELAKQEIGGTPEYMAPERFGKSAQAPDKASDIYSLGVLFYYVSVGKLPFNCDWRTLEERMERLADLHRNAVLDFTPFDSINSDLGALVQRMLNKAPGKRPAIALVLSALRRQENDSVVRSVTQQSEVPIIRRATYRWNPEVHDALGHRLAFVLIKGVSFVNDLTWLRNNLDEQKIHGFSAYRVLGGYDYLLRLWVTEGQSKRLLEVLDKFRVTQSGDTAQLFVQKRHLWYEKKGAVRLDIDGVMRSIFESADTDERKELKELTRRRLVTSALPSKVGGNRDAGVRFFVRLDTGVGQLEDWERSAAADFLADQLMSPQFNFGLRELSVFTSHESLQGWAIVVKFRLRNFFGLDGVYKNCIGPCLEKFSKFRFVPMTFVEMDALGYMECDDGPLVDEATDYARQKFDWSHETDS